MSPIRVILSLILAAFEAEQSLFWGYGLGGMRGAIPVLRGRLMGRKETLRSYAPWRRISAMRNTYSLQELYQLSSRTVWYCVYALGRRQIFGKSCASIRLPSFCLGPFAEA